MRQTRIIIAAVAGVLLSMCCIFVLGSWYFRYRFPPFEYHKVFRPQPLSLFETETLTDASAILMITRRDDNSIESMTVTSLEGMGAGYVSSGGYVTGHGHGGVAADNEPAPEPRRVETEEERDQRNWDEAFARTMVNIERSTVTFALRGSMAEADGDCIIVTPEDFRRFDALLVDHDIVGAVRECWKDDPAVMKRLDEITGGPDQ